MKIGMLGTGNLATTLGSAWAQRGGHSIVLAGRNRDHAQAAAHQIGPSAAAVDVTELADNADIVVVAISWSGLTEALELAGAAIGKLAGKTVIDCTNPLDFSTATMLPESGSAAEHIARAATGAHVVKALHMFAGASWPFIGANDMSPVVAICGDDATALSQAATLISDLGARPAAVGGLDAARQLEEAAGFVMRVVGAGMNPRFAVPDVDPALFATKSAEK
jgi:predicted dinucleotide-binding enzyme